MKAIVFIVLLPLPLISIGQKEKITFRELRLDTLIVTEAVGQNGEKIYLEEGVFVTPWRDTVRLTIFEDFTYSGKSSMDICGCRVRKNGFASKFKLEKLKPKMVTGGYEMDFSNNSAKDVELPRGWWGDDRVAMWKGEYYSFRVISPCTRDIFAPTSGSIRIPGGGQL